jgi:acetylornithine/succinyldiaminopimelate/putrescine aminotransferase
MFIKTLFEEGKILCQMAGNNYLAIKSLPPLVVSEQQIDTYCAAVENVCDMVQHDKKAFWGQGLKIAARAFAPLNEK